MIFSKKTKLSLITILLLSTISCSNTLDIETEYPQDIEIERRNRAGRLTGDGIKIFGGSSDKKPSNSGANVGIGINSYLWRSTLDTLSFMPLASADPFGGVIITDWYENTDSYGEKFKVNVLILDSELRTDALKVSLFKQVRTENGWIDVKADESLKTQLENKILTTAREYKIKNEAQ